MSIETVRNSAKGTTSEAADRQTVEKSLFELGKR